MPPSVGVATFDILDKYGQIYDHASTGAFAADTLSSKPINLEPFSISDSLYFSFYYQPKGLGWDTPDSKDSLILEFCDKNQEWQSVWSVSGTPYHAFKQVMIPVIDSNYFYKGFKFRFHNYASLGDPANQEDAINNDFWHLDYVVLDTNRTINDTTHKDVSFISYKNSLFYDYYSVPWRHYKLSEMTLDSVSYLLKNHYNEILSANNQTIIINQNETLRLDSAEIGSTDINPLENWAFRNSIPDIISGHHIPSVLYDSTIINIKEYINSEGVENHFLDNDTVRFTQKFYNYYAYDDGTAENGLALVSIPEFAFKITALKDDTLRGMSMFFNRYHDFGTAETPIFSLCVWSVKDGLPDTVIYQEDNINPQYNTGVNNFYTYKFNEAVYVDTTFFIGFINDSDKNYSLGYDFNNNNNEQVFYNNSSNWLPIPQGTPMIRAIMGDDFEDVSTSEIINNKLKIYPNPSSGLVKIEWDNIPKGLNNKVEVFNTSGRLIYSETLSEQSIIDLSQQKRGIYIFRISNSEYTIHKKMVKQ